MKLIKEKKQGKKIEFPCLLEDRRTLTLWFAVNETTGICLDPNEKGINYMQYYAGKNFHTSYYHSYEGKITLEND